MIFMAGKIGDSRKIVDDERPRWTRLIIMAHLNWSRSDLLPTSPKTGMGGVRQRHHDQDEDDEAEVGVEAEGDSLAALGGDVPNGGVFNPLNPALER